MERPTTQQTEYAAAIIATYLTNYGTGGSSDAQQRLAFAVHAAMGGFGSIPQEYASIPVPDGVTVDDEDEDEADDEDEDDTFEDDEDDPEVTEADIDRTLRGLTKAEIIDAYPDLGLDMEMTQAVMVSTIKEHYLPSADE